MNEEVLQAIRELTDAMNKGFSDMSGRFETIEKRLSIQEKKARKTYTRQKLMEADVQALKDIIHELAEKEPCRVRPDGTAIRKEAAYEKFGDCGIGKVKALCALRDAGVIRTDATGKNTCTIWLDNKPQRVLIVLGEGGE